MKTVQIYKSGQNHLTLKVDTAKLESLSKALGIRYFTEVGILGSSSHNRKAVPPRMATERQQHGKTGKPSQTQSSTLTNAQIGTMHEYGVKSKTSGGWAVPPRSFLWMPLSMHLMQNVNTKADVINRYFNMAQVHKCYELLGIIAENTVQDAFKTGGFGTWPKLAASTIARKGSDKILIDTSQLRRSITSRVVS